MATSIRFRTTRAPHREEPTPGETTALLRRTAWDDFGFRTTFMVYVSESGAQYKEIGTWKILDLTSAAKTTELPAEFEQLDDRFVALAQHLEILVELGETPDLARAILLALRDLSFNPNEFASTHPGFETSLIRFVSAHAVLSRGRKVLHDSGVLQKPPDAAPDEVLQFNVRTALDGFSHPHVLSFDFFAPAEPDLSRLHVIVGQNGCGKTRLLARIVSGISGLNREKVEFDPAPTFKNVIAVSYSPWDDFPTPRKEGGLLPYIYCGLLKLPPETADDPQPKDPQEYEKWAKARRHMDITTARERAAEDYATICGDEQKHRTWRRVIDECKLADRGPLARFVRAEQGDLKTALETSSAGVELATIVLTRLVRHLKPQTLVVVDEPELHTHPALLSAFLRALHDLLKQHDSYGILATHSPLPLQEVPSHCIQILDIENDRPMTSTMATQSFGGALADVIGDAFRTGPHDRNWARRVRELRNQGFNRGHVLNALRGRNSIGVDMLFSAMEHDEDT